MKCSCSSLMVWFSDLNITTLYIFQIYKMSRISNLFCIRGWETWRMLNVDLVPKKTLHFEWRMLNVKLGHITTHLDYWMLQDECWTLNCVYKATHLENWMLNGECWTLHSVHKINYFECQMLNVVRRMLIVELG